MLGMAFYQKLIFKLLRNNINFFNLNPECFAEKKKSKALK